MLWSISVNLVVLQGLMRTPQDCKVMKVATCKFVSIWSYIRRWQCHRMLWNVTNGYLLQNLVIFVWNYPYWFAISSQRLSYCNVNQNSCRPTTASLSLSWVDLLAHFLLLIDCDSVQKNELTSSTLSGACAELYASHDECFAHFAPYKVIQESLRFWIPRCGFWTPYTGFWIPRQLNLDYVF